MNSDGSEQRPINATIQDKYLGNFEWSPDGKAIAVWGELGFYIINIMSDEIIYQEKVNDDAYCCASWSPNNKEIALGTGWSILIKNVGDGALQQSIDVLGYVNSLFWSPDGKKIAFSASDQPICKDAEILCSGVFVMNFDGSELIQLTSKTDNNYKYRVRDWTPDGKYILFDSIKSTSLMNIDDLEVIEIEMPSNHSVISKDGKYILYASKNGICKIKIDELNEICLTDSSNGDAYLDW